MICRGNTHLVAAGNLVVDKAGFDMIGHIVDPGCGLDLGMPL